MTAMLFPIIAGAQAQITTKKIKIADFPEKITKIVLTGNDFYDLALRDEIAAGWTLKGTQNMEFVFAECDLAADVDRPFRDLNFDSDMLLSDED